MRILAVDPGGNTGFAEWEDGEWRAWYEPAEEAAATIHRILAEKPDVCVCESFHIGVNTGKMGGSGPLVAIELIGVGRYLARVYGVEFVTQSPSEAKTFCTDDKLKALDMWTKGVDHPRDATRHLVTFLAARRLIDLRALRRKLDVSAAAQRARR